MFIAISLVEFLRFPLGLFGSILGSFWSPPGIFGVPLDPFWVPFGVTLVYFGGPWAPLGNILDDFGIILGPSDCRKGSEGDEEWFWDDFLLIFGYIL